MSKAEHDKKPGKAGGLPSLTSTVKHIFRSEQLRANLYNLKRANQDKGFDCPGCAWGDKKEGLIQFCENGAKAIAWESTAKTIDRTFFDQHSVSYLRKQSDFWLEYQGRLAEPLVYDASTDKYQPISWDDAFGLIAQSLNMLESAKQLELYTSGRASNEAAYLYQLFGRMFGTNNFPDCSNMCHEASGVALNQSVGVGKGTVTLDDFDQADAIFVFGQNPGSNHPRMMNALRSAARKGCKIVTFNNLKEVALERFASPQDPMELLTPMATKISHAYFTPKLGGDMAAIRGMVKYMLEQDEIAKEKGTKRVIDEVFVTEHTQSIEEYIKAVSNTPWSKICEQSGLSQKDIEQAAKIYLSADKVICTWAMGLTQHKHSVISIQEIVNLQLLRGNLGKPGAGLCPVRGHSNVQGNRTVGINEKPKSAFIDALNQRFSSNFDKEPGHNTYHAIKAMASGESKVLICLGGNIAAAAPDTQLTCDAIANCDLTVQISTKLNRSHLYPGKQALILPCLGRTELDRQASGEQAITVEDTFSMVHASMGKIEPASPHLKSETAIVCGIAAATLANSNINWQQLADDYCHIRDLIEQTIPGFSQFNERIAQPGGFYLGNNARELVFDTTSGKAQFSATKLPEKLIAEQFSDKSDSKHSLLTLQSMRSHDQYNTTIYGYDDRYRGISNNRSVLFINEKDANKLGFADGDLVDITSVWENNETRTVSGFTLCFYEIPRGNVAAYYPETNPLVPLDSVGDESYTPTSKAIAVYLSQSESSRIL
ncbi:FdhF/YdeP family oxidoreductase [Thalassotalea mangrovi]|uniref:FdhF/YdeP family oxidoreductase n=1 Tax=Thalassotalea mangrovi TaxID=2572245 RepID=A0A4V6WMJ5_9GAMM|nr:FdhF/YdeP family oxidoreductase [Thalassotalea mangrovi]TKB44217.1 FdhF/YdeP family oxidoreductase [Thalassotalea mangrovi]